MIRNQRQPYSRQWRISHSNLSTYRRLPFAFFLSTVLFLSDEIVMAQDVVSVDGLEAAVTFLADEPQIDGRLDPDLNRLPRREFSLIRKEDEENPSIPANYRLAYGHDFLYLYVEAEAEQLVFRDRAYQNGDGFAMVLAVPRPDNSPTDEFYVLAASAVREQRLEWTRRIFWYYNVDNIFLRTSDRARLEFQERDGRIGFELLLPWQDVHPYHPWLSEGIGFNLAFVKAIEPGSRNFYQAAEGRIGSENQPREYMRLTFDESGAPPEVPQSFLLLDRSHIRVGESLSARVASATERAFTDEFVLRVTEDGGGTIGEIRPRIEIAKGFSVGTVSIPTTDLPAGEYLVEWNSSTNGSHGEAGLTVLPGVDPAHLSRQLAEIRGRISEGSHATIDFLIEEIKADLARLKPYETANIQRLQLGRILNYLDEALGGNDLIAAERGFVRRGYRSDLDGALQPYVVWVPPDFDPRRRYPLFVFLHGSASTERDILGQRAIIPQGFIAVSPKGRGPSNAWSWDNAQSDVAEAIAATKENYPIDGEQVVLSGFSMGGYGVYRTFYENPEGFKALVVLSGAPNTANRWSGTSRHPNFLEPRYLAPFESMPIFVFHGRRDRNVAFDGAERVVEALRRAGAAVEFRVEDDKGHSPPSRETIAALHAWLAEVLGR